MKDENKAFESSENKVSGKSGFVSLTDKDNNIMLYQEYAGEGKKKNDPGWPEKIKGHFSGFMVSR